MLQYICAQFPSFQNHRFAEVPKIFRPQPLPVTGKVKIGGEDVAQTSDQALISSFGYINR